MALGGIMFDESRELPGQWGCAWRGMALALAPVGFGGIAMTKKQKPQVQNSRSPIRKRLLAGGLAVVTSGVGVPYAWQGMQGVWQYFTDLRSDVSTLKVDQAQLRGQVTQIQSDLEVVLGRQMQHVAQGGESVAEPNTRKDETR